MAINEYETEDQQIAALKKWWKENSTSLIVGLLVGVATLFGWRYYTEQTNLHSLQASNLFMQLMQDASQNGIDAKVMDINNALINEYSDTPYASLSSLALAKVEYTKNNIEETVIQLELAIKNASDEDIKQIATLRLISVYIEQEKYDEVSTLLATPHDKAYDARYEELKGDLYNAKGDIAQARAAYDNAIGLYGATASKILRLKRENLGSADSSISESDASGAELVDHTSYSNA